MKSRLLATLIVGVWLSGVSVHTASAHPGHEHREGSPTTTAGLRTWKDASGTFELPATFVAVVERNVQLRKVDGTLLSVPLTRLSAPDQEWVTRRQAEIRRVNMQPATGERKPVEVAADDEAPDEQQLAVADSSVARDSAAPAMHDHFLPFADSLKLRWDGDYYYVGSNGMPDHPMMIGIRAWQQQVPLPQKYYDDNAWRIPLHPVPAAKPASAKGNFLRGAIALAVNGVPIFNPLNNRGDDAYLFGELDEYGGHCGRADDYHYHIAPVHLEKNVGKGKPIAYALDGYPIYGYDEADGSKVKGLDWLNGHKDADGHYHYHATKTYPYLNGGFYGEVVERDGQVDPQPRAQPVREALPPLRGAKITGFTTPKPMSYLLTYEVDGRKGTVGYTLADDGSAAFQFTDPSGQRTNQTYSPRARGPGGPAGGAGRPPRPGDDRPPQPGQRPPRSGQGPPRPRDDVPMPGGGAAGVPAPRSDLPQLKVSSSAIRPGENFPKEFTCDGEGVSPPVEWSGAPQGTKCFALSCWHVAPDQEKSYWVVYDIPVDATKLEKNSQNVGRLGINDMRRAAYEPMCSKGPGVKTYHITVFALSTEPKLSPAQATRANLLAAIKDITLAEGTLTYQYQRAVQE